MVALLAGPYSCQSFLFFLLYPSFCVWTHTQTCTHTHIYLCASILHPSLGLAAMCGHSFHCWLWTQQDVEISVEVCVCVCTFVLFFFSLFWFCVLADFFTSWRIWKGCEIFFSYIIFSSAPPLSFSLHVSLIPCSFAARSLPLTPCLLWLCTNRFHMLLQLTSVSNYFTCDLQYFLRKSVKYLLKTNRNKPPWLFFACLYFPSSFSPSCPGIVQGGLLHRSQKPAQSYYCCSCF